MTQELYELPEGWEWKKLIDICELTKASVEPQASEIYNYIGLENIQGNTGKLIDFTPTKGSEISSTKVSFLKDSVLYGKLRPYLNKVLVAPFAGIATTEILPFKCTEKIIPSYLAYFLRSDYFVKLAVNNCSGARMPRVTTKFFQQVAHVPVPSNQEQQRLVKKLDALLGHIDTAIEHLEHSLELNDQLFASSLNQAFNPLDAEVQPDGTYQLPEGWEWKMLNDIAEVARGKSKHRPRNDKTLFNGDYPFIQTGDVRNAVKYIESYSETYNEKGLAQSKLWPAGTICLTIAANIGDVAILKFDACFPDSVVGITPSDMNVDFIYHFLSTIQKQLDSKANSAAQKNINLRILSAVEVPTPSRHKQEEIVKRIDELQLKTQANKQVLQQKLEQLQQLKASLLDSAFRGEL